MEVTIIYILSQIFTILNYVFLMLTYQLKSRTKILVFNFLSLIATAISFALLKGFSGVAMTLISMIRNILFMIEKDNDSNGITKKNILILFLIIFLSIICAIWTYNGVWSLMAVFASITYTYSIWQKSIKIYKILGIQVGIFSIIYNIYIKNIFGIILEAILTIFVIIGYIKEKKS